MVHLEHVLLVLQNLVEMQMVSLKVMLLLNNNSITFNEIICIPRDQQGLAEPAALVGNVAVEQQNVSVSLQQ